MMYRILFAFLALGFAAGGVGTLLGVRFYTDILDRVGVGKRLRALISWLEIAAAAALIAGLFYPLAGIAASDPGQPLGRRSPDRPSQRLTASFALC
jgi:hypothetical protein